MPTNNTTIKDVLDHVAFYEWLERATIEELHKELRNCTRNACGWSRRVEMIAEKLLPDPEPEYKPLPSDPHELFWVDDVDPSHEASKHRCTSCRHYRFVEDTDCEEVGICMETGETVYDGTSCCSWLKKERA